MTLDWLYYKLFIHIIRSFTKIVISFLNLIEMGIVEDLRIELCLCFSSIHQFYFPVALFLKLTLLLIISFTWI